MNERMRFTIPNWEKFNPRSDRANYSWFRLQNGFFHDAAVFPLTDSQKVLWLFLLCEASKKNSGLLEILPKYASAILQRPSEEIIKDIECLCEVGLMTAESRRDDGNDPALLPATYVRTNETNVTDVTKEKEKEILQILQKEIAANVDAEIAEAQRKLEKKRAEIGIDVNVPWDRVRG